MSEPPAREILEAMPTPTTEPTRQWEVETAKPRTVEERTATAAPICTEKDLDGVRVVILPPTVAIVREPRTAMPNTKPAEPIARTCHAHDHHARRSVCVGSRVPYALYGHLTSYKM